MSTLKNLIVLGLVLLALAGCSPQQAATPNQDAAVVMVMRATPNADAFEDSEFVTQAHKVCDEWRAKADEYLATQSLLAYGFNPMQAQTLMGVAHKTYCP